MSPLDRRSTDLRQLVKATLHQFQVLETATANGPHVDLSLQELRLLEHLGDEGPRMMRELAAFLLLAVNSVTSTVDGLEEKGIVRRLRSEQDRRVVRVELTAAGQKVYAAAVEEKHRLLRSMLQTLTDDEQEIFMVLFRKIARDSRQLTEKTARLA